MSADEADVLSGDAELGDFFEAAVVAHDDPKAVAGWIVNELLGEVKGKTIGEVPFSAEQLGALVALIGDGTISRKTAKEVFQQMAESGGEPAEIVETRGLVRISDASVIEPIVDGLLADHPEKAEQYRSGKTGLLGFFVGQVMQQTGGTADPELVQELIRSKLS